MGRSSKKEKERRDEEKKKERRKDREDDEKKLRSREERKRRYHDDDQSSSGRLPKAENEGVNRYERKGSRRDNDDDDLDERKRRHRDDRKRRNRNDHDDDDEVRERKHRHRDKSPKEKKHRSHGEDDDDDKRARKRRKDAIDEKSKRTRQKSHKSDKKDEKKAAKSRSIDKAALTNLGRKFGRVPDRLLDSEKDYFEFHQHLWVYLFRDEGTVFNDLSSEESHAAFARFVKKYNAGDLEAAYYDPNGLPPDSIQESKTTLHKWSFSTSDREEKNLEMLREGIRKQTEFAAQSYADAGAQMATMPSEPVRRAELIATKDRGDFREQDRRVDSKRMKEIYRDAELELMGGPKEGRERELEKRKDVADRIHGASKQRDDAVELPDDVLYGGGEDRDFHRALAREKDRRANRETAKQARLEELKSKEAEKQENMLKMLGLSHIKPGKKIEIAPRRDS